MGHLPWLFVIFSTILLIIIITVLASERYVWKTGKTTKDNDWLQAGIKEEKIVTILKNEDLVQRKQKTVLKN